MNLVCMSYYEDASPSLHPIIDYSIAVVSGKKIYNGVHNAKHEIESDDIKIKIMKSSSQISSSV